MKSLSLILILTIIIIGGQVFADTNKILNPNNGHYYQRIDSEMSWHDAKNYCKQVGAHLATITSEEENSFLFNSFKGYGYCWLGGTDENIEGSWEWITGEAWTYDNWYTGEPSNHDETEDYLELFRYGNGQWNNDWLNKNYCFICEWDQICDYSDSDDDGVIDYFDDCPDTPQGSIVYSDGCPAIRGDFSDNKKLGLEDCIGILQILSGTK